jgi:redox-sensitive bicupin YhaK (pirin superfamily)
MPMRRCALKKVLGIYSNPDQCWVGDDFPVGALFSYDTLGYRISALLSLDFAGPAIFGAAATPLGVRQHPHRGFATATTVYEDEVAHRDSTGLGRVIGPGRCSVDDVGERHPPRGISLAGLRSQRRTVSHGATMGQSACEGEDEPTQVPSILDADIPSVDLLDGAGRTRVIAGDFDGVRGPARTRRRHTGDTFETKSTTRSRAIRQGSFILAVAAALTVAACAGGAGLGLDPVQSETGNYCVDEAQGLLQKRFGPNAKITKAQQLGSYRLWKLVVTTNLCEGYFTFTSSLAGSERCTTPAYGSAPLSLSSMSAHGNCADLPADGGHANLPAEGDRP